MWALVSSSPQIVHRSRPLLPIKHRVFINAEHSSSISLHSSNTNNYNNTLIQSLCRNGNLKQALQILPSEPNLTQHTYELLIHSCSLHNSLSDALSVHQHLIHNGFGHDSFLATKLIDMYSDLQSVEYALQVFHEVPRRSIYVWNAILRALALAGHGVEALGLYRKMNWIGVPCDRFTHTYALKACVVSESTTLLLDKGKEIHGRILREGYESNIHIMTTLLDMYAKFGNLSYAGHVFNGMPAKNVVSWSAMIACYAKNGSPFRALHLFHEMVASQDFSPNSVTMVNVLQACAALGALGQGKMMHCYILRRGLDSILPVTSALLMMYARCGNLKMAQRIFDRLDKKDIVSWNSLIASYGIHGFGLKAIRVFQEMIEQGIKPTSISFVSILGACSHAGLVHMGKRLFESMVEQYGISPGLEHYACMVDLLGRANRLNEAAAMIENLMVEVEPGPKVWGSLLGSCRIHGNVELAEKASTHLFELEPTNAGNYIVLADTYAAAQMWDKVKAVKNLLEARGLHKVSGQSWIEVRRNIYSFKSVDELNPHIEQIHALLVELSGEMKLLGYIPQTQLVLYDLEDKEKERILLGHSEKLAVAFGLINTSRGETIRISKNLRLCEDCHTMTKFISKFTGRDIMVRDVNRFHHFHDGACSCGDYW